MPQVAAFLRAFADRRLGKLTLIGLAAATIAFLARLAFEDWVMGRVVPAVLRGARELVGVPIGYAGLALFGWLFAVATFGAVAAYLETSPALQRILEKRATRRRPKLSLLEREEIQVLRHFWNRYAVYAFDHLNELVALVLFDQRENVLWGFAADLPSKLAERRNAAERAVADDSVMTLAEVQQRVNEHTIVYREAYDLLIRVDNRVHAIAEDPRRRALLERWRASHLEQRAQLEAIFERPAQRDRLMSWRGYGEHPSIHLRRLPFNCRSPRRCQTRLTSASPRIELNLLFMQRVLFTPSRTNRYR